MEFPNSRILIFAKPPINGHCKTRLGRSLGMHRAANIHRQLVEISLGNALACKLAPVQLHCAGSIQHPYFHHLRRRYAVPLVAQTSGDLGRRMRCAVAQSLVDTAATIIIGTDCPLLAIEHLRECLRRLHAGDAAVFIPSEDGGYALVGLSKPNPLLFRDINWGSTQVFSQTRQRLRRSGMRWSQLPDLWDVDVPNDYRRARRLGLL